MKKKNAKSIVNVVDPVSMSNICDYSRANGKCGRALCDNFGKLCPGRSCEDWKCDAEGDASTAVAVVEPKAGALDMSEQDVATGIRRQCKVIEDAEKNAQLERAKLGVLLIRWEQYLGESRGRGNFGGGLKGWLEENVPELNYKTAVNYKSQAEMALKMLGGGAKAQAVLLDEPTVMQPDGEVIEVDAEYVAKRDKIFEDVKSRRQLEQTYFKFMASEGKKRPGRPKGSKADYQGYKGEALQPTVAARALWSKVMEPAMDAGLGAAAKLLEEKDVVDALAVLEPLVSILKKRKSELKA